MNSKLYDRLKYLALVVFPALGAAYFSLADLWHLPKALEVVGTIAIIDTLLGATLGFSSAKYNASDAQYDGEAAVWDLDDETKGVRLILDKTVEELGDMTKVVFKVSNTKPPAKPSLFDEAE